MRIAAQLALLLLGCAGACFVVSLFQPITISGTAINVVTGKPMPYVRILFKDLNASREAAIADVHGKFTAYSDRASYCCALYAGYPKAGTLLQGILASPVFPRFTGEHFAEVTVYAVPATELSGHVYDEASHPIPGCQVEGLTGAPHRFNDIAWIGWALTDAAGAFQLTDLGVDRYQVVAQCKGLVAASIPIVLKPGSVIRNLDFHLHRVKTFSVHGSVVLLRRMPKITPVPFSVVSHDLVATRLDSPLASLAIKESCSWPKVTDQFQCDLLAPGTYRLKFTIDYGIGENSNTPPQEAEVEVMIEDDKPPPRLSVHMQGVVPAAEEPPPTARPNPPTGTVVIRHACPTDMADDSVLIEVLGSDSFYLANNFKPYLPKCSSPTTWTLAAGNYRIVASVPSIERGRNSFEKLTALLERHAQPVKVLPGAVTQVTLRVWTQMDIVKLALDTL